MEALGPEKAVIYKRPLYDSVQDLWTPRYNVAVCTLGLQRRDKACSEYSYACAWRWRLKDKDITDVLWGEESGACEAEEMSTGLFDPEVWGFALISCVAREISRSIPEMSCPVGVSSVLSWRRHVSSPGVDLHRSGTMIRSYVSVLSRQHSESFAESRNSMFLLFDVLVDPIMA